MSDTLFRAIADAARVAAHTEPGATDLKGFNKDHIIMAVDTITVALDTLDVGIDARTIVFALTFVKNGVVVAMKQRQDDEELKHG